MEPAALAKAVGLLEDVFKELEVKRAAGGGFVQGCQHVSATLQEKLESAGLPAQRCILQSPYGPFINTKTNDYVHYHFFILLVQAVFDPFTSSSPVNLSEYLKIYQGDQLHVGVPLGDSYTFVPIDNFTQGSLFR